MNQVFSYDTVPYPSYTFPKTFPDTLATMAALYGVSTADPANCRLLEIGCGDGTNLLGMAYLTPESTFTGIDLSRSHIAKADRSKEWINAKNVKFIEADITQLNPEELGEFDYIVAHGLFSWVPEQVRTAILGIYSRCLASNGIGYISYNVFPGGHIRRMVWDMMSYFSSDEPEPAVRVRKARAIAAFVADSAGAAAYKAVLQKEVESMVSRDDQNLFHDDLGPINRPFYFYEFVELLKRSGFCYVADADPDPAIERRFSDEGLASFLALSKGDKTRREQLADFIRGTRFRCSLFCHNSVSPLDHLSPDALDELMISTRMDEDRSSEGGTSKFVDPEGPTIELNHPLTIRLLRYVRNKWPQAVPVETALDVISDPGTPHADDDVTMCRRYLTDLIDAEMIRPYRFQASFAREVSARPEVSRFARLQVELGCRAVTTIPGSNVELTSNAFRVLISLLDGTRDRAQIINEMENRITVAAEDELSLKQQIPQVIEKNLQEMRDLGLLVA